MSAAVIIVIYLLIGCGAAIAVVVQGRGSVAGGRAPRVVLMLLLWPFLLPTTWLAEPVPRLPPRRTGSERAARIERIGLDLRDAWARSTQGEAREREVIEGFLDKLARQDVRLGELEEVITSAQLSIRPKLLQLRDATAKDVDEGLVLLEELLAQLTLLRFAGLRDEPGVGGERDHVENLLVRIEALANLERAA